MKEYLVPTGDGEAQFIERRSRFIGHIFLTETEEEALARLKQMREQYWDATHNVYAYIIRDGATRFSDDGEPGGTAGMPVLQVLQREELYNVTCVVTRYFGGILLGAGGLVRAYAHGAKIAVDAAGRSIKRIWTNVYLPCPYSWYERIRLEVAAFGGMIRGCRAGPAAAGGADTGLPRAGDRPFGRDDRGADRKTGIPRVPAFLSGRAERQTGGNADDDPGRTGMDRAPLPQ